MTIEDKSADLTHQVKRSSDIAEGQHTRLHCHGKSATGVHGINAHVIAQIIKRCDRIASPAEREVGISNLNDIVCNYILYVPMKMSDAPFITQPEFQCAFLSV